MLKKISRIVFFPTEMRTLLWRRQIVFLSIIFSLLLSLTGAFPINIALAGGETVVTPLSCNSFRISPNFNPALITDGDTAWFKLYRWQGYYVDLGFFQGVSNSYVDSGVPDSLPGYPHGYTLQYYGSGPAPGYAETAEDFTYVDVNCSPATIIVSTAGCVSGGTWTVNPGGYTGSSNTVSPGTYNLTVNTTPRGATGYSVSSTDGGNSLNVSYGQTKQFTINYTCDAVGLPNVDIKANSSDGPISITYNTSANLTWTTSNSPTSCTASNNQGNSNWTGGKGFASSNSQSTGPLTVSTTFSIYCSNSGGNGPSDSVTVNVVPATPTGLTAIPSGSCGTGTINVSWDASPGATSYTLRDGSTDIYTGPSTSFSHTGLVANSSHSYTVLASNAYGSSVYSSSVPATAPSACPVGGSVDIKASNNGSTFSDGPVYLGYVSGILQNFWYNWSSSNTTSCSIGAPVNSGVGVNGSAGPLASSHPQYPSVSGTTYPITCNLSGGGTVSDTVFAQRVPNAPTINASTSSTCGGRIDITWSSVAGATSYSIYRDGGGTPIYSGSGTSYTDTVTPGTSHYYNVRAFNAAGSSLLSSNTSWTTSSSACASLTVDLTGRQHGTGSYVQSITLPSGSYVNLQWSSTGPNLAGTICTATGGWWVGSYGSSGTLNTAPGLGPLSVNPTDFGISCNDGTTTAVDTFRVNIGPATGVINVVENGASGGSWVINPGGYTGTSNTVPAGTYSLTSNSSPASYVVSSITSSDGGNSLNIAGGQTKQFTVNYTASTCVSAGAGTGLRGTYYDGISFNTLMGQYVDSTINFDPADFLGTNRAGGPDTFSVRWEGQIEARCSESYTFYTRTDDGTRLWVNGSQIISRWVDQAPTEVSSAPVTLTGGTKYNIVMEYYENTGGATAQLSWASPSTAKQIIPQTQLFPLAITAPSVSLSASPTTITSGQSSTLTWTSTNATSCTASGGWSGSKLTTGGSENVSPTSNTTYTLTCTGPGGTTPASATVTVSGPAFDYSLSNSGNISVTKSSSAVNGSNTITRNYIQGTTQAVSLSASGLPSGVSVSFAPTSCSPNPTCPSTATFTVQSTAPPGTHPITVTGTSPGTLDKTTFFNLIVSNPAAPTITINGPSKAGVGQNVPWSATVVGGTNCTYTWSGTEVPTSPAPTGSTFNMAYSTTGSKTIRVDVSCNEGTAFAQGTIIIALDPIFEEF